MSCWRLLLQMKETLDIVRHHFRKAGFKIPRSGCCHGQNLKEWWSYFQTKNQNMSQDNRLHCSWYKGHSEEKKFRCRSNDFNTHFNSWSMGITGPITWNIACLKFYSIGILKDKLVAVVLVTKLCPTLCDPVDCSPPVFSVLGILQARIVKWGAIPFSRGSSWPIDQTQVSCIAGRFFTIWAIWEACKRSRETLNQEILRMQL